MFDVRGSPRVSTSPSAVALIVLTFVILGGSNRPALAQPFDPTASAAGSTPNIEGFTVSGKGFVSAKPNLVEVDMDVSASSELTADAIVKYRDAKKRIRDAFAALKLNSVSVEERGLLVDQKGQMQSPYYFDVQPNPRNKTEVQLSRKLVVKAVDIRKMDEEAVLQLVGRLLDVAQDAGAKVGPQTNMIRLLLLWIQSEPAIGAGPIRRRGLRQAPGRGLREGDRRRPVAGGAAGAAEPGRARADRRHPRGLRARRGAEPRQQRERRPAAQAAGDVEVPGDPGPRGAAGAFRCPSSQGRARRGRPDSHEHHRP